MTSEMQNGNGTPALSIIVVSWNCRDDLRACLQSLQDANLRVSHETIVVDNSSTDGTVLMVERDFPEVRLIAETVNHGFAAANNLGMREASGRYLFLLNPDTLVLPGIPDALVGFMDERPESMMCGPVLLNTDGSPQNAGVRFPSNWNILCETLFLDRLFPKSHLFGRHRELFADPSLPREIDVVHGAAMMVRRSVLESVGGLDEDFFVYFEETDWCWRIRSAGGRVHHSGIGSIVHHGGSDSGHYDERRLAYYHKSLLLFYRKHYSAGKRLVLRPLLVVRSLIRILSWMVYGLIRPARRAVAFSCIKGYVRTIRIVLT